MQSTILTAASAIRSSAAREGQDSEVLRMGFADATVCCSGKPDKLKGAGTFHRHVDRLPAPRAPSCSRWS